MAGSSEKVEFEGSDGSLLAGRLDLPDGAPRAYALFAHCFTCSKDVHAVTRITRALTGAGFAVLRFDFTGLGGSAGDFANTDFSSNVEDLVLAGEFLATEHQAPQLLIGHSLGGAAVIAASPALPDTRAVVTIGAPAGPEHVLHLLESSREEIERDGEAQVNLAGRLFCIRQSFLDDVAEHPQLERLGSLDAALLVMHAPQDDTVGIGNARTLFEGARHPKSFVALDGADHLLTAARDAAFAASVIAAWADRYVCEEAAPDTGASDEPALPEGSVRVVSDGSDFGQRVQAGSHAWRADEPVPTGTDTGPSPYDLLLAGLGACTSMTLGMYARRKKLDLRRVSVELSHSRVHADDCEGCEAGEQGPLLARIERVITLDGDLDDDERERLLAIADKCPVHRTLEGEVSVVSRLGRG